MHKKLLGYALNIVAVLLIAFAVRYYLAEPASSSSQTETLTSETLFAASFPDVSGKLQALSQWQGKIIVVNFWATWCPPCLEEMPELSRLQDQYQERGVVVLGISTDELDKIREFAKATPVSYPLLSGTSEAMDLGISLGNDKGVLPYTAIIKADGSIAKTFFGRVDQAQLEQTLLPMLESQNKSE